MSRGVIMYNRGTKCAVRLAVACQSIREHYSGPVTILSQGADSHPIVKRVCKANDIDFQEVDWKINRKGQTYLNACLVHKVTPYETSIWLDSDILVRGSYWPDVLWQAAEENQFAIAQISNWTVQKKIASRVRAWEPLYSKLVEECIELGGPAINCGVFAFHKDSELMRDWYRMAEPGRELSWIPDETCCQTILHSYPHKMMSHWYNVSCKHDKPHAREAQIIHYHGRKHCRIDKGEYLYGADLWWEAYDRLNIDVSDWVRWDRQLRQNLRRRHAKR